MKKLVLLVILLCSFALAFSQSKGYIRNDSTYFQSGQNAELIIFNSTRDTVGGFLFNKGGGRTIFKRILKKIDSVTYLIGLDTLKIPLSSFATKKSLADSVAALQAILNTKYDGSDTDKLLVTKSFYFANLPTGGGGGSYTFLSGLTNTSGTVTNDLITGKAGGQTVIGGTGVQENLTLLSTTNTSNKGRIYFGSTGVYDEVNINTRFGVGTQVPNTTIVASSQNAGIYVVNTNSSLSTIGAGATLYAISSALATAGNQKIGQLIFGQSDVNGGANISGAMIAALSDGAWTSSSIRPTYLTFSTANTANGGNPVEAFRINSNQEILIAGTTSGGYKLDNFKKTRLQDTLVYSKALVGNIATDSVLVVNPTSGLVRRVSPTLFTSGGLVAVTHDGTMQGLGTPGSILRIDTTAIQAKWSNDITIANIYSLLNTKVDKSDSIGMTNIGTATGAVGILSALSDSANAKFMKIFSDDGSVSVQNIGDSLLRLRVAYIFNSGLTNTSGVVKNDLITGKAGGQSIYGGTGAGESLKLYSTTNATLGKIYLGDSSMYDASNASQIKLGIGTVNPSNGITVVQQGARVNAITIQNPTLGLGGGQLSAAVRGLPNTSGQYLGSVNFGFDTSWSGNSTIYTARIIAQSDGAFTFNGSNVLPTSLKFMVMPGTVNAGYVEAMRITSNKNLLIGSTTDQGYALDVLRKTVLRDTVSLSKRMIGDPTNDSILTIQPSTGYIRLVSPSRFSGGGGGTTSPAGSNTQVQFNNSGAFGAVPEFAYNAFSGQLAVTSPGGSDYMTIIGHAQTINADLINSISSTLNHNNLQFMYNGGDLGTLLPASTGTYNYQLPTKSGTFVMFGDTVSTFATQYYVNSRTSGGTSYTFVNGLSNSSGTVSNDFYTGKSGGNTLTFGTGASEGGTIRSTSNASKGSVNIDGVFYFNATNGYFGIGTSSASKPFVLNMSSGSTGGQAIVSSQSAGSLSGGVLTLAGVTPTGADQRIGGITFGRGTSDGTTNSSSAIESYSDASWGSTPFTNRGSYIAFYTWGNTASSRTEAMRITSSQGLAIGTTSNTSYKLDVAGKFRATDSTLLTGLPGGGTTSTDSVLTVSPSGVVRKISPSALIGGTVAPTWSISDLSSGALNVTLSRAAQQYFGIDASGSPHSSATITMPSGAQAGDNVILVANYGYQTTAGTTLCTTFSLNGNGYGVFGSIPTVFKVGTTISLNFNGSRWIITQVTP